MRPVLCRRAVQVWVWTGCVARAGRLYGDAWGGEGVCGVW